MTFLVNGIKEDWEQKQNREFLIVLDKQDLARNFLDSKWLIILSMKDFSDQVQSYGNIFLNFMLDWKSVQVVGKDDWWLKGFCLFFMALGIDVLDVNFFEDPQSPEQVQKVLQACKLEIEELKKQKELQKQQAQATEKKFFNDQNLVKAKEVIEWLTLKIADLLTEKKAYISSKDLKTIKEKEEELKKLRMGTNYEKIKEILQEMVALVESIEMAYFDEANKTSEPIFTESVVSTVDAEKEVTVLEKVKKQMWFGWMISPLQKDYQVFGEKIIFVNFLKKDLLNRLNFLTSILFKTFDLLELFIFLLLIQLSTYSVLNLLFSFTDNLDNVYMNFVSFGWFGLVVFGLKYLRKENLVILILLFLAIIPLYFWMISMIKNSFALM